VSQYRLVRGFDLFSIAARLGNFNKPPPTVRIMKLFRQCRSQDVPFGWRILQLGLRLRLRLRLGLGGFQLLEDIQNVGGGNGKIFAVKFDNRPMALVSHFLPSGVSSSLVPAPIFVRRSTTVDPQN
jgi:hypothetical protein